MSVSRHTYATREQVMSAGTMAGDTADVDRLIESQTDKVERTFSRRFHPSIRTRLYTWPSRSQVHSARLWFDDDVLSITTFEANGSPITDYFLGVDDDRLDPAAGPYAYLDLDTSVLTSFGSAGQRNLSVAAVWGYSQDTAPAGTLAGTINDSVTALTVSDASLVGVGDLIQIGTERMVVADRAFVDTTANLDGALIPDQSQTTVKVTAGSLVRAGEVILVDGERMLVTAVTGNDLTVRRAHEGSTLAAHENATDVYAARALTVIRGAYGTTAASHNTGAAIVRNVPPALITELVIAECIAARVQEASGYAATLGPGGQQTSPDRVALLDLRKRAREAYERSERIAL